LQGPPTRAYTSPATTGYARHSHGRVDHALPPGTIPGAVQPEHIPALNFVLPHCPVSRREPTGLTHARVDTAHRLSERVYCPPSPSEPPRLAEATTGRSHARAPHEVFLSLSDLALASCPRRPALPRPQGQSRVESRPFPHGSPISTGRVARASLARPAPSFTHLRTVAAKGALTPYF
jgi:hypothetical protein